MLLEDPRVVVFATSNPGKLEELRAAAAGRGLHVAGPHELCGAEAFSYGLPGPLSSPPEVQETGGTYLENARLKAEALFAWSGLPSLADDTGLEVEALSGRPGLHTARYAGEGASAAENRRKLLQELAGAGCRRAVFRCVLFLRLDAERDLAVEAVLPGSISEAERGQGGFGYDSIFSVDGYGLTLAELKEKGIPVKTHRILALEAMIDSLRRLLSGSPAR